MKDSNFVLEKVLNLKKWQALQDSIAAKTHLAIVTVDYKGAPITTHSNCSKFCMSVRGNLDLCQNCHKCDSRGGLEAVRLNKPYIYLCHYDIVDIAIPIIINNNYVGAVMAGQVKLTNAENTPLENILTRPKKSMLETFSAEIIKYYEDIPTLSYDEVNSSADMLSKLCNYIVEEALNRNMLIEMYERLFQFDKDNKNVSAHASGVYPLQTMEIMKNELTNAITNSYIDTGATRAKNSLLQPAFEYLNKHLNENITLGELANLCNLSHSYFSRLFAKESGDNFSNYMAKLKINRAIALLENTRMTIAEISDSLGFSDPSYFNRTFKKVQNITPALYRKFYAKN